MSCTIKKAAARSILLAIIPNDITRLFTLPPGVPVYGVAAMRKAFDVTFTDPEFQAFIEKTRARAACERKLPCWGWICRPRRKQILKIN